MFLYCQEHVHSLLRKENADSPDARQVAEGVATAGGVIGLARKYRVQLPVLTAVAQVLDGKITPRIAVEEIMNLPQIEEH